MSHSTAMRGSANRGEDTVEKTVNSGWVLRLKATSGWPATFPSVMDFIRAKGCLLLNATAKGRYAAIRIRRPRPLACRLDHNREFQRGIV